MLVVEVACKDEREAQHIASTLVRERLAACANIIPAVSSFFYWDGNFTGERESIVFLKTVEAKRAKLEKRIRQLHSYKLPAMVSWKAAANKDYEKWVKKELSRH